MIEGGFDASHWDKPLIQPFDESLVAEVVILSDIVKMWSKLRHWHVEGHNSSEFVNAIEVVVHFGHYCALCRLRELDLVLEELVLLRTVGAHVFVNLGAFSPAFAIGTDIFLVTLLFVVENVDLGLHRAGEYYVWEFIL